MRFSCAVRRTEDEPTRRSPRQFGNAFAQCGLIKASRGILARQERGDRQAIRQDAPACPSSNGRQDRWLPASSASSISLVKRPLPPISEQGPVADAVAGRGDGDDLDLVCGEAMRGSTAAARVSSAWASARREPRVPILRRGVCTDKGR